MVVCVCSVCRSGAILKLNDIMPDTGTGITQYPCIILLAAVHGDGITGRIPLLS